MEIGGSNTGASTYAMKKAMEMPSLLLSLVQQTGDSGNTLHRTKPPETAQVVGLDTGTDKGKNIDILA